MFLQVGPGVMSANALPPYESWDQFSPVVETGVQALLNARQGEEKDREFTGVILRYIDAFKDELLDGKTFDAFIDEILGFHVKLPPAVENILEKDRRFNINLQTGFSISGKNKQMNLQVAEGMLQGGSAVIMDMTIAETAPVQPQGAAIMQAFASSREIIHEVFVEVTRPIHHLMKLVGG
jgi:uncharacterized protein (TIGR04255 family)